MAVNRYYSNTAVQTTLTGGINNSVTSFVVGAVTGFPVSFPYTIVLDEGQPTEELVTVTSAAGTTLTVTRGSDNTTAASHSAGAAVKHVVSARDFREPQEHIDTTAAHGATGAVVGTTNAQTLTGKSIALGSNTLTGTLAQINAMITDADLVSLAGVETLTNKTLTAPVASGSLAGFGGAWGTYVPVARGQGGGAAVTLGTGGTITGRYIQIGKIVHVIILYYHGSTAGSVPAGPTEWTLPVNARGSSDWFIGTPWMSLSNALIDTVMAAENSNLNAVLVKSPTGYVGNGSGLNLGANHRVYLSLTYEAA